MTPIARTMAPAIPPAVIDGAAQRHPVKALAESLQADDLSGAKRAYAQIIRQAPPGATWNPDGGMAHIGRALREGDVEAARKAAQVAWEELKATHGPGSPTTPVPRTPTPAESKDPPTNTDGMVGTRLNVVA